MRTDPLSRKRYASQPMLTIGGLYRIMAGAFGLGDPRRGLATQEVASAPDKEGGPYNLVEGDVFLPGTGNFYTDPTHETPLFTTWGHAFLRLPNTFMVAQPPQLFSHQMSSLYGVGGQIAGQIITQPLSVNQETGASSE